jgi:hypothetical protein
VQHGPLECTIRLEGWQHVCQERAALKTNIHRTPATGLGPNRHHQYTVGDGDAPHAVGLASQHAGLNGRCDMSTCPDSLVALGCHHRGSDLEQRLVRVAGAQAGC